MVATRAPPRSDGGQRTSNSKSATPKTYVCIFLDFFIGFFAVWPSNDLESDIIEVNGPCIQNQRPQKPMYVFFSIFLSVFLQFDLQMTLSLIWWRSKDLVFKISDPKNLCMYFSGFFYPIFCSLSFKWPCSNMMEVKGPRFQNQRPQKPMYVFFWIF